MQQGVQHIHILFQRGEVYIRRQPCAFAGNSDAHFVELLHQVNVLTHMSQACTDVGGDHGRHPVDLIDGGNSRVDHPLFKLLHGAARTGLIAEQRNAQHRGAEEKQQAKDNQDSANIFVKISNGENSAEIHTGNGHRLSKSQITINDQTYDMKAKVYDGKTYVDFNFVKELQKLDNANNYTKVGSNDISPARSYENIGPLKMPV